jgi:hypothetical protein
MAGNGERSAAVAAIEPGDDAGAKTAILPDPCCAVAIFNSNQVETPNLAAGSIVSPRRTMIHIKCHYAALNKVARI